MLEGFRTLKISQIGACLADPIKNTADHNIGGTPAFIRFQTKSNFSNLNHFQFGRRYLRKKTNLEKNTYSMKDS